MVEKFLLLKFCFNWIFFIAANKENRPEVERGRGRRRFRGFVGQSRDSGAPNELRLASQDVKSSILLVSAKKDRN